MLLNDYQNFTDTTAMYNENVYTYVPHYFADGEQAPDLKGVMLPWLYPALALGEEAGEVLGKLAKFIRKGDSDVEGLRELVKKELGDVLYQTAQLARQFDLTLEEIATENKAKLEDRMARNVIIGEGDAR